MKIWILNWKGGADASTQHAAAAMRYRGVEVAAAAPLSSPFLKGTPASCAFPDAFSPTPHSALLHRQVLSLERTERAERKADMEVRKAENMLAHADEISARPARSWFQTETQKKATAKAEAEGPAKAKEKERAQLRLEKQKEQRERQKERKRPRSEEDGDGEDEGDDEAPQQKKGRGATAADKDKRKGKKARIAGSLPFALEAANGSETKRDLGVTLACNPQHMSTAHLHASSEFTPPFHPQTPPLHAAVEGGRRGRQAARGQADSRWCQVARTEGCVRQEHQSQVQATREDVADP